MKQLTIKIVIPLTIISFLTFTKWWFTLPVDSPDTMFSGFPLPFVCDGWHTSMSLYFFITELIIDLMVYFTFWFGVIFCIDHFLTKIRPHKILVIILYFLALPHLAVATLIICLPENNFYFKRDFDMEIMETGYKFYLQSTEQPDYEKYRQEIINE